MKARMADGQAASAFVKLCDANPAARQGLDKDEMPLPAEPRTIFLGGLFVLALLAGLYVASAIVLPVVLAIVLKLLLQPLVRLSDRLGVPHAVGAELVDLCEMHDRMLLYPGQHLFRHDDVWIGHGCVKEP